MERITTLPRQVRLTGTPHEWLDDVYAVFSGGIVQCYFVRRINALVIIIVTSFSWAIYDRLVPVLFSIVIFIYMALQGDLSFV